MTKRDSERDLELMAYCDGMLDHDPARKAEVEEWLRQSPEDAARAEAYLRQTAALRQELGGRIEDPVPDRLYEVLRAPPPGRGLRRLAQAALIALLTIGAGAAGWILSEQDRPDTWSATDFLAHSQRLYLAGDDAMVSPEPVKGVNRTPPMSWLSEQISMTVSIPSLSRLGYTMTDKKTVSVGGEQMVRLDYAGRDGHGFALFLRPRWGHRAPKMQLQSEDDVTAAYWFDGPLASALVARVPPDEMRKLAEVVRSAMRDPKTPAPVVESRPPGPLPQKPGLAGDASGSAGVVAPRGIHPLPMPN